MRYQGQISEWNDERGFGFVRPLEGSGRVFVHISAFPHGSKRPASDDIVSYELSHDDRGRPRAMNVTYISGPPLTHGHQSQLQGLLFATIIAVTFLTLVAIAVSVGLLHWAIIVLYILASIVTYLAYADDKRAAQTSGWRTKEGTLLLLGLAGGWPGGLIAQYRLRHKTKKVSFQVAYWLTVGLNCGGLLWLHPT
jgi:uncharacterized membrane protein YsdA (DUF1294 family)/cold shock CspA family protein